MSVRIGKLGALLTIALLAILMVSDLVPALAGEIFAADVYYLPLRDIPLGEHREAVEESIVQTSMKLNRHGHAISLALHVLAMAGAVTAYVALMRAASGSADNLKPSTDFAD